MRAAVRENLLGAANREENWLGAPLSQAWVPPHPASGQLSTHQWCQPGGLRQRQTLLRRRGCRIPHAFQWCIWKTSQTVHLPWHKSLYFRGGFQGRQWEEPHLLTEGGWHFFPLSGTSACLVMLCPRRCSCWWMCVVSKGPLGARALLGETLRLVLPPSQLLRSRYLGWAEGTARGTKAKEPFSLCRPHHLVVSVFPFLSLLFSVEAGNQMPMSFFWYHWRKLRFLYHNFPKGTYRPS